MSLHPTLKWAQRKDKIYITIGLRDIIDEKVNLKVNTFDFQCQSGGKKYQLKLQFYEQINQQKSQWSKTGFQIVFVIAKNDIKKHIGLDQQNKIRKLNIYNVIGINGLIKMNKMKKVAKDLEILTMEI